MAHILSLLATAGLITSGLAMPVNPDEAGPLPCNGGVQYQDTNQYDAVSLPIMLAGHCYPGAGTCNIGQQLTLSFTVTVNEGVDFGIDTDGVAAGITAGVSFAFGTATGESTGEDCVTGDYTCGSYWTAALWRVEGNQVYTPGGVGCGSAYSHPYSVDYPLVDSNGISGWTQYPCVCAEYPYSVQPYDLCPDNCIDGTPGPQPTGQSTA